LCYKNYLEPLTHFLTGACLARAGFNRKTALATATMTLAAEAPDLDVLGTFKGPVFGFAHHRGFTHSFLGLILMSALVVGFMYLIWRLRGRKTNIPNLPPRWGLLFLFAYIAGLSHILLDYTNNYGVHPLWPFSETWYSWDIVFIVEPILYVILGAGLIAPLIFSRHKPLPRGRIAAILALVCVAGLYAVRDHEHRQALHALEAQTFDSAPPLRVSVYPYPTIVTRWYAVIETRDSFVTSDVNSLSGRLDPAELLTIPKPMETPATRAAKQSDFGRVYLAWAQYPLLTEGVSGEDTIVYFHDLRFGYPSMRGRNMLSGSVELDDKLHVVAERLGNRSQQPPD
jgi:inner membrane protein